MLASVGTSTVNCRPLGTLRTARTIITGSKMTKNQAVQRNTSGFSSVVPVSGSCASMPSQNRNVPMTVKAVR